MTDPITDMFNRIMNAQKVFKPVVDIPYSSVKFGIAEILKEKGFVGDVKKRGIKAKKIVRIDLLYQNKIPVISGFKKISRPGQRIYKKANEIKFVKNGYGLAIVSTSQGLMTDRETRKKKLGGEVMVEVW